MKVSRRHTVYPSRKSWQDSRGCSQPDPLDSGDRSQHDPQILAGLGTPSQSEPQILALTVRASPKLVRQMSSALTELKINWMFVDI
ncbi:hypothetical protein Prudu_019250, partial [Prunus dulcis]